LPIQAQATLPVFSAKNTGTHKSGNVATCSKPTEKWQRRLSEKKATAAAATFYNKHK